LLVLAGEVDRLRGALARLLQAACQQIGLTEPGGVGRYVNYLDHDELGDPVAAAYGSNSRRLQELKAKYDPSNFFHMNQNIKPTV
jgi:berberine-like enzyme